MSFGGVEAGGAKFVCAVGTCPQDLARAAIPTTSPSETLAQVIDFFRGALKNGPLAAIGVGSFGPVDLDPDSPTFGHITSTPKAGWAGVDICGAIGRALNLPVAFDTDVNAAALAEYRWGAAQGLDNFLYVTVGTGIGGGALVRGIALRGRSHPEMGHMRIPHDRAADPFPGTCPFHGDCLEGLASGFAMERRWGVKAESLPADHPGWRLEAQYLTLGLVNLAAVLSPERIVIGGGVMHHPELLAQIRENLHRHLNGYIHTPEVVPPLLGDDAGVVGAIALAANGRI